MYTPSLNIQSNGVPKLSGKEIDIIGERYAVDFQPDILRNPGPIDIESFLELYLGLNLDFQYLSHRCVYLGMVVFNDADIPVYCPERGRAEAIHEDEQTVVVDKNLLNQNQDARLRFTYGHECGHWVLHTDYFRRDPNQLSFLSEEREPIIACRMDRAYLRKRWAQWTDRDWIEWHANRFSAAVLMPETAVRSIAHGYDYADLRSIPEAQDQLAIDIANTFKVSLEAAYYRLSDLRICNRMASTPIDRLC